MLHVFGLLRGKPLVLKNPITLIKLTINPMKKEYKYRGKEKNVGSRRGGEEMIKISEHIEYRRSSHLGKNGECRWYLDISPGKFYSIMNTHNNDGINLCEHHAQELLKSGEIVEDVFTNAQEGYPDWCWMCE